MSMSECSYSIADVLCIMLWCLMFKQYRVRLTDVLLVLEKRFFGKLGMRCLSVSSLRRYYCCITSGSGDSQQRATLVCHSQLYLCKSKEFRAITCCVSTLQYLRKLELHGGLLCLITKQVWPLQTRRLAFCIAPGCATLCDRCDPATAARFGSPKSLTTKRATVYFCYEQHLSSRTGGQSAV